MSKRDTLKRLRDEFKASAQYKEIWVYQEDGQAMLALINGETGWLMYLRHDEGDAGFSSRNPAYTGPEDALQEYILSNGQLDEYPLAWVLPVAELRRVMEHFVLRNEPAPWINWHNDGDDGVQLGPGSV